MALLGPNKAKNTEIKTTKENGLPHVLFAAAKLTDLQEPEALTTFMPWSPQLPGTCRMH
ncbi:hypothetical protein ACFTRD_25865 [Paenibacillus sp. NPDC056933]|uniref:hypothetical protein n=1 Tax=Paenibacillus sp. NPDC056933 TaxID=3345968 RepID=UPI00362A9E7F